VIPETQMIALVIDLIMVCVYVIMMMIVCAGDVLKGEKNMKRDKPEVGQTIYSLNVGNACRGNREQFLTPMTVVSVGKKYFYLQEKDRDWPSRCRLQFYIDTWCEKSNYLSDHRLYAAEKEWLDEKEESDICTEIYKAFEYRKNHLNLSLDKLRAILAIVKEEDNGERT